VNCTTEPIQERVALGAFGLAWYGIRVRLWLFVERRVRVAYDDLVEAER
jgi:hypothetical protein